jgi:hypothetical protein
VALVTKRNQIVQAIVFEVVTKCSSEQHKTTKYRAFPKMGNFVEMITLQGDFHLLSPGASGSRAFPERSGEGSH